MQAMAKLRSSAIKLAMMLAILGIAGAAFGAAPEK